MATWYVSNSGNDITGDGTSIGTAWATIQHALDNMTGGQPELLYLDGTFTPSAALDFTTLAPTNANFLVIAGYNGARTDVINCNASNLINTTLYDGLHFFDIKFTNTPTGSTRIITWDNSLSLISCEFDFGGNNCGGIDADNPFIVIGCYFHNFDGPVSVNFINGNGIDSVLYGNYFHGENISLASAAFINMPNTVVGNVFNVEVTTGGSRFCQVSRTPNIVYGNIFYNRNSTAAGAAVGHGGSTQPVNFINNVFCNWNNGINTAGQFGFSTTNAFYNCTTDVVETTSFLLEQETKISLTADPFTSTKNTSHTDDDFTLNNISGGGALLRNLGYPLYPGNHDTTPFSTRSKSNWNVGAIMEAAAAAGGAGGGGARILQI